MMQDFEYELLKIKAAVTPQKEPWPSGDVQVSIIGDKPTISGSALHWSALHACVDDARGKVTQVFAEIAAIEDDKTLTREGKDLKMKAIGNAAIASFEKSKTLTRARASVESQLEQWNEELGLTPEPADTVGDAMIHAEIRSHLGAMKPAERVAFIDAHATEVAAAVLTAPAFLTGLTPADLGVVRQRIEARTNPEVAAAKQATMKALSEAESGWRSAIRQINERAGLGKAPSDGAEKIAQRAGTSV